MNRIGIVFPGQASQYVGMGRDLYDADARVRQLYEVASDRLGEDIAKLSFEGPAERLKETRFTQPAILLHSLSVLTVMNDDIPAAALTAGHSLGEYASLALTKIISYEESVLAVIRRATLMEEACRKNPGTMAAVMGLEEEQIVDICKWASAKGVVVPANFNSSNQVVISGSLDGVEEAGRLCREAGAKRVIPLQVGGAFHSPLMESATAGMKEYLEALKFKEPQTGLVPNVTGTVERKPDRIKELLVAQLTAPVRWYQTMKYFRDNGIDTLIEIGPGKVLTGLAKRELDGAQMINLDTMQDIQNFVAAAAK
jgi:[acyl-carrier-protein] S-malonyltransferase